MESNEKSEELRGLGVKKAYGVPAAGPKKSVFFCGASPFLWGEPIFVGEAQEKQTNKQTNEQKTKHFFSFLKRRTPYVIRMKDSVALLLTQQK